MSQDQTYEARAGSAIYRERMRQRELGYDIDHDLLHEPPEWVELLAIQLGHLSAVNLHPPTDSSGRRKWLEDMREQAVHLGAIAHAFIAQLEIRIDGLKEQGKEIGRG